MKKITLLILILALLTPVLVGCSSQKSIPLPSDEEIMEKVTPFLSNTEKIDVLTEETLASNLALTYKDVKDVVLYMGAPLENTTYFCMLTLTEDADRENVKSKLTNVMEGWVKTGEQGYITGFLDYKIIEKQNKIFVVMHENAEKFEELTSYLNGLSDK